MLETASLRSKQPAKSSLKTYGSKNKRMGNASLSNNNNSSSSLHPPSSSSDQNPIFRKYDWDRIDYERKLRIDEALAKVASRKHNQKRPSVAPDPYYTDEDIDSLIYSDPEDTTMSTDQNPSSVKELHVVETVSSTQGSESESSQGQQTSRRTYVVHARPSRRSGLGITVPSTQTSDSEHEAEKYPFKKSQLSSKSSTKPSVRPVPQDSIATPRPLPAHSITSNYISKRHSATFLEKSFSEHIEDEDDADEDLDSVRDDEVLFRTPSFDILQRLKQLPRPRFPEPQRNLFALESIATMPAGSTQQETPALVPATVGSTSISTAGSSSTMASLPNPFMGDIKESPVRPPASKSSLLEKRRQLMDMHSQRRSRGTPAVQSRSSTPSETASQFSVREPNLQPQQEIDPTRDSRFLRARAPESKSQNSDTDQDTSLEQALGKRISTIEITPKRMQAKLQKTSLYSSASSKSSSSRPEYEPLASSSLPSVLNRNIPGDVRTVLLNRRESSPGSPTPLSMDPSSLRSSNILMPLLDRVRTDSPSTNGRSTFTALTVGQNYQGQPLRSDKEAAIRRSDDERKTQASTLDSRSPIESKPSSLQPPQPKLCQDSGAPRTPMDEQTSEPSSSRKTRSLRRPPTAVLGNRVSTFKPSVQDLLSFCDQSFFDQFRSEPGSPPPTLRKSDNSKRMSNILDFDSLLPSTMARSLTKIGEASYSEVYTVDLPTERRHQFISPRLQSYIEEAAEDDLASQGDGVKTKLVMKVLPFLENPPPKQDTGRQGRKQVTEEDSLLALEDIYRETMVSTQIIRGWKGFIGSFGALVVRGKYPKIFLSAWDRFKKENGTESYRPDTYEEDQLYCIILLPYGGIDLEHCPVSNWQQAWTVLAQIAASLESKEQAPFWFEHRDLHWGNILVKGTKQGTIDFATRDDGYRSDSAENDDPTQGWRHIPTFGILVQMIDFTLARMQGSGGKLIYMDLEKDQDIFRGQNDYQFEIYRKMRKQIARDWASSCPRTNLFWLHYLADKLLTEKGLEKPRKICPTIKAGKIKSNRGGTDKTLNSSSVFDGDEYMSEVWCYERLVAVSQMNIDRDHSSSSSRRLTPSSIVLEILLQRPESFEVK
ncbi:hypothetical protein BGZ83_006153 [Gryganskiella cystojenkinii]|nr:hypothetical protein BGZ83_006153 [Gryganskiella cystojenkinii]